MEIVYIDSLFLLNFIIDYLLLLAVGKICALPLRRWRMLLGALWGAVYAVLAVLLPRFFAFTKSQTDTTVWMNFSISSERARKSALS